MPTEESLKRAREIIQDLVDSESATILTGLCFKKSLKIIAKAIENARDEQAEEDAKIAEDHIAPDCGRPCYTKAGYINCQSIIGSAIRARRSRK